MPAVRIRKPTTIKHMADGRKLKIKGKVYHCFWRGEDGRQKSITTGCHLERTARQFAAKLQLDLEMGRIGMADPYAKHKSRPLTDHLKDFKQDKLNSGKSIDYVTMTERRLKRLIESCRFLTTADIEATKVNAFLAELRTSGKRKSKADDGTDKGSAVATCNHFLTAANVFFNWLVSHDRMAMNPLVRAGTTIIERQNPEDDRRWERRALSLGQFYELLDSAAVGPPIQTISGADRRVLYIVAAYTGYRRRELGSILPSSFDLEASQPTLTVEVRNSKRRKLDVIPLRQDLAQIVREWLASKGDLDPTKPVLPVGRRRTAKMIRLDLERVGIPYIDAKGRAADFHGLRKSLATAANQAGVSLATTQKIMRHSTPNLTANTYTDVGLGQMAEALEKLPPPVRPAAQQGPEVA